MRLIECGKKATISFREKRILISSMLAKMMDLKAGCCISIARDFDNPSDFYIIKSKAKEGNVVIKLKENANSMAIHNKSLYETITKATGHTNPTYSVGDPVNIDGITCYPIITRVVNK